MKGGKYPFVYVCVALFYVYEYPQKPEEGIGFPGTGPAGNGTVS